MMHMHMWPRIHARAQIEPSQIGFSAAQAWPRKTLGLELGLGLKMSQKVRANLTQA